jgi:hypothetical protein
MSQAYYETLINQINISPIVAIPNWLRRERLDIQQWIIDQTIEFPVKNIMERIYIILNGEPPRCKDNNFQKFNTFTLGYRQCCHLGNKCLSTRADRLTHQQQTLLTKYGVTNASTLAVTKEKTKQTNLLKYGVEHSSQNALVKEKTTKSKNNRTIVQQNITTEKIKNTNLKKYGVTHHMKLTTQQEKVKNTNIERTGNSFPLQSLCSVEKMKMKSKMNDRVSINKKTKQTLLDTYGVTSASRIGMSSDTLAILDTQYNFCEFVKNKTRKEVTDQLDIAAHTLYLYAKKYDACELFARPLKSQFEIDIAAWLTDNKIDFIQNNRTIISPKELDFFLPKFNIAIECCGLYWHGEISASRNPKYHSDKHKACSDQNIQLITIFEDEWKNNQDKIKQLLTNKLIGNNRTYARKCKIIECTIAHANTFINAHHLQGTVSSKIKLGLTLNDQLVAIMTFGKSRFNGNDKWEIHRYCTSMNIVGGANKLLSHFISQHQPTSIVSYSDNRYFTGKVYDSLGFQRVSETIGFYYTDYHKRYNRLQFQKHKLVEQGYDSSLSEWEIMKQRKFDRIWDCGQVKWMKTINNSK